MFDIFITRLHIAGDYLYQRLSALLRDKTAEIELPDYVLSNLAHAFLADIAAFFTVEESQVAYETWKNQRENILRTTEKS